MPFTYCGRKSTKTTFTHPSKHKSSLQNSCLKYVAN